MLDGEVTLVGHPFAPIGMGQHLRSTYRSLGHAGIRARVRDVYGRNKKESAALEELGPALDEQLGLVNIFHINGDEVEEVLSCVNRPNDSYNIVFPLWELSRYPVEWARQLDRFDEIWAPSLFVHEAIAAAAHRPVLHMPIACEVHLSSFLGRRYFGLPESPYLFLFSFDLRSYTSRKNPEAVIECFRRLKALRPGAAAALVIKMNGPDGATAEASRLSSLMAMTDGGVVLFNREMTDNEAKNLLRCSDCFVSLHRSEGYGLGLAESMYLGKPVIATAYSGNLDYMTAANSFLVKCDMVAVPQGAYPFWRDQVWAAPDLDEATSHMLRLVDDPDYGLAVGRRAGASIRATLNYDRVGLRYSERLDEIRRRAPDRTVPAPR